MGASETKLSVKKIKQTHVLEKDFEDPRFGNIQIFRNASNNQYVMLKEKMCRSMEEQKLLITKFRERSLLVHNHLLQIVEYEEIKDDFMCGNFNKFIMYFEFHYHDLFKEIFSRRRDNQYFSEEELWYLIDSLVSVLFFLQKHKICHEDIRSANILLTKDGVVKIADMNLLNDESSVYFKLLSHSNIENHYVCPEIMESLKKSSLSPQYDMHKNDVFAFGMTILEAATLEYSSLFYDYEKYEINSAKIKDALGLLKERYSPFLINFMADLLQEKEKYRPNFEDLYSLLLPFHSKNQGLSNNPNFKQNPPIKDKIPPKKVKAYAVILNPNEKFQTKIFSNKENSTISEKNASHNKQTIFKNGENVNIALNNDKNKNISKEDSKIKKETDKNVSPLSLKDNNLLYQEMNINPIKSEKSPNHQKINEKLVSDYECPNSQIKFDEYQTENDRLNEIERKINEALRLSEETIKMHEFKTDKKNMSNSKRSILKI